MTQKCSATVEVGDPDLFVDDGELAADESITTKAIETLMERHADELLEIAEDLYHQRRSEEMAQAAVDKWEDEHSSEPSYSSYEEGKALDAYEHSHGW